MTQQQVADLIHTSKANVCSIERSARENIQRAKETLEFVNTLDARLLCVLKKGSDLFDSVPLIIEEAQKDRHTNIVRSDRFSSTGSGTSSPIVSMAGT